MCMLTVEYSENIKKLENKLITCNTPPCKGATTENIWPFGGRFSQQLEHTDGLCTQTRGSN